ncbi:MAG: hypothetical protein HYX39_11560 [Bacteroidetes bacterium]|nr:hypothetical protein [Bacteroidota bacterium]
MTTVVQHRFLYHKIDPSTEILILGTFNPETENNPADFFYGRSKNYLWRLLPNAYQESDLKGATKDLKIDFIKKYKIDFIDLIAKIDVEHGKETDYYDGYIDGRVTQWQDVISVIKKNPSIKRICFTRKSFSDIPNMTKKVEEIKKYCISKNIDFEFLPTPARFYNTDKQTVWSFFLKKA